MITRSTIYGNVGRIQAMRTSQKTGKRRMTISVAENREGEKTAWYEVTLREEIALRFVGEDIQVGDFIMIDLYNLEPAAYRNKRGDIREYMKAVGGLFQLIAKGSGSAAEVSGEAAPDVSEAVEVAKAAEPEEFAA